MAAAAEGADSSASGSVCLRAGGARRVRCIGWHSWPGCLVLTSMGAPLQQSAASALPEGSHMCLVPRTFMVFLHGS